MRRAVCCITAILGVCPVLLGQELLTNPSFDLPSTAACVEDSGTLLINWLPLSRRNGDFFSPACPRDPGGDNDDVHGSIQAWGNGSSSFRQTVSGLDSGKTYQLTGLVYLGKMGADGELSVNIQLQDGSLGSPAVDQASLGIDYHGTPGSWIPFCLQGSPSGSSLTVFVEGTHNGLFGWALHVDDFSLTETTNTDKVSLTAITPSFGEKGLASVPFSIEGSGFTLGTNSVDAVTLIRPGEADIPATGLTVNATTVNGVFDLSSAVMGRYSVRVTFSNAPCSELILPGAYVVANPVLANGSFELPNAPAVNCGNITPLSGFPDDWLAAAIATWDNEVNPVNTLFRDSDQFPAACPPINGDHYASSESTPADPGAKPEAVNYQIVRVDNTKSYLATGYFAGSGKHTTTLDLLDGDDSDVGAGGVPDAAGVAHQDTDSDPDYDWTFAFAELQPSGDLMTVRWRVTTGDAGPHVSNADQITLTPCEGPEATPTSISVTQATNDQLLTGVTITGTGFSLGGPPLPVLVLPGQTGRSIVGFNVSVVNDSTMTCDFDIIDADSGEYDLVILKDGCTGGLSSALSIIAANFVNGGFELPDPGPGAPPICGAPPLFGIPEGWSAVLIPSGGIAPGFDRDHDVFIPATCPSPAGGHFASLTWDRGGDIIAYQTIAAVPDAEYTFGGWFAGGGAGDVVLELRDGNLDGTLITSEIVHESVGTGAYDWKQGQVVGQALSDVITVVWKLQASGFGLHASHADGLTVLFEESECGDLFADTDKDEDVDQADFALWQLCYTGSQTGVPAVPSYCICFDRNEDDRIDQTDLTEFINCATGPSIPASIECDD